VEESRNSVNGWKGVKKMTYICVLLLLLLLSSSSSSSSSLAEKGAMKKIYIFGGPGSLTAQPQQHRLRKP